MIISKNYKKHVFYSMDDRIDCLELFMKEYKLTRINNVMYKTKSNYYLCHIQKKKRTHIFYWIIPIKDFNVFNIHVKQIENSNDSNFEITTD